MASATPATKRLTIWASGCSHVSADRDHGRESLADAIRQAERDIDWDIAINVGDFSAAFGLPTEDEGAEIVRQFGALGRHRREDVYTVCGNHDRNAPDEPPGQWFRAWIDPEGTNTPRSRVDGSRYRYPIHGTWERYWFRVGNVRVLMMSDVNEPTQIPGRGELGGNPGGVVSQETFDWWVDQVDRHRETDIIVSVHHYLLKDTTVATGAWEGMKARPGGGWQADYHGYYAEGTPEAASHMHWVGGRAGSGAFEAWLAANPGKVDLWLGGHTHTNPDDTHGGKSHVETAHGGTTFVNVAALTRWFVKDHAIPHSRVLTFEDGSDRLTIDCYMHTDEYRPQGFYEEKRRVIELSKPFHA